jgi:hypothetical protein
MPAGVSQNQNIKVQELATKGWKVLGPAAEGNGILVQSPAGDKLTIAPDGTTTPAPASAQPATTTS